MALLSLRQPEWSQNELSFGPPAIKLIQILFISHQDANLPVCPGWIGMDFCLSFQISIESFMKIINTVTFFLFVGFQ